MWLPIPCSTWWLCTISLLLLWPFLSAQTSNAVVEVVVARQAASSGTDTILSNEFQDAQVLRFGQLYPNISVSYQDFPTSTTLVVDFMVKQYFEPKSTAIDLFPLDVIWSGDVAQYLADLNPLLSPNLTARFPAKLIENNSPNGQLVALPTSAGYGILMYRTDLLAKYNYSSPPTTYLELEQMSLRIMQGENRGGQQGSRMYGFVFQGYDNEALLCNALEWIYSAGGGSFIELDATVPGGKRITINNPAAIQALTRARSWVATGGISPINVLDWAETDSFTFFASGHAVFHRIWQGNIALLRGTAVEGKVGVTYLPAENVTLPGGGGAAVGGSGAGIVSWSTKTEAAAKWIEFTTSPQEQERAALVRGFQPVLLPAYINTSSICNMSGISFCTVDQPRLVVRPSTLVAPHYADVATAIFTAVHDIISGNTVDVAGRIADLECELYNITTIPVARCERLAALRTSMSVHAALAVSSILSGVVVLVVFPAVLYFRRDRVIHYSGLNFCLICLTGLLSIFLSVLVTNLQVDVSNLHCYLRVPLFNLGFMLSFGPLLLKSFLLHRIFNNTMLHKLTLRLDFLYVAMLGLIAFDAVVLGLWFGLSPFDLSTLFDSTVHDVCPSPHGGIFEDIMIASKGVLLLAGSYFTYKIRHLPAAYNESRFIGLTIYTSTLLAILCLLLEVGLSSSLQPSDMLSMENGFMLLGAGVALILLFGSKAVLIYQSNRTDAGVAAAASRLHDAFAQSAKRVSEAASGTGENSADGLVHFPLDDATVFERLQAELEGERVRLHTTMQTAGAYAAALEKQKTRVDAQLERIGLLVQEYDYQREFNPAAKGRSALLNTDEFLESLTPKIVVNNEEHIVVAQSIHSSLDGPGKPAANSAVPTTKDPVVLSRPVSGPRPFPRASTIPARTVGKADAALPSPVTRTAAPSAEMKPSNSSSSSRAPPRLHSLPFLDGQSVSDPQIIELAEIPGNGDPTPIPAATSAPPVVAVAVPSSPASPALSRPMSAALVSSLLSHESAVDFSKRLQQSMRQIRAAPSSPPTGVVRRAVSPPPESPSPLPSLPCSSD